MKSDKIHWRCSFVNKALWYILSFLLIVFWVLHAGQLRKAVVGNIDSVWELKLLDLSQLLISPLKLGKANKVGASTIFHRVRSGSCALFKTTLKFCRSKRRTSGQEEENGFLFLTGKKLAIWILWLCSFMLMLENRQAFFCAEKRKMKVLTGYPQNILATT